MRWKIILAALCFISLPISAKPEEMQMTRPCLDSETINLTGAEYEAFNNGHALTKIHVPTREEISAYIAAERQAGVRPNLSVFFWSKGLFICPDQENLQIKIDMREMDLHAVQARHLVTYGDVQIELQGSNLTGADLSGSRMAGIDATSANFARANLENVRFGGNFDNANFTEANLRKARMNDESSWGSSFVGADFTGADLQEVVWGIALLENSKGVPQASIKANADALSAIKKDHEDAYRAKLMQIFPYATFAVLLFFLMYQKLSKAPEVYRKDSEEDHKWTDILREGEITKLVIWIVQNKFLGILRIYFVFMLFVSLLLLHDWLQIFFAQDIEAARLYLLFAVPILPVIFLVSLAHIALLLQEKTKVSAWFLLPVGIEIWLILMWMASHL